MPTTVLYSINDEGASMTVMIGVDPHKGSHTAVAVDAGERSLAELRVRSGPKQLERLLGWAERFPQRTWAVENATGLGYLLAQQLVAAGERVLDVQPKLAARVRLLATESTNKNDPHDALSVAIAAAVAIAEEVGVEDHAAVMKLWARRHRNLSSARTQVACRLHAVLCDLVAGGVPDEIYAEKAASLLADVEPDSAVAAARVELATELLDDLRRVDRQLAESKKRLEQVVAASGTTVIDIFGVGPVVAATVVGVTGDISRFPTRDRFAAFNATAPIEVSSGGRKVWRLSRRGNRTVNHAIHMAAVTQLRFRHSPGRGYYDRKMAEGKTPKEALRALKRRLSDALWAAMVADAPARRGGIAQGGPGGATGERLCRQRGRLSPRNAGSSAKPLPSPNQGYDDELAATTCVEAIDYDGGAKNCLTNKEDSICVYLPLSMAERHNDGSVVLGVLPALVSNLPHHGNRDTNGLQLVPGAAAPIGVEQRVFKAGDCAIGWASSRSVGRLTQSSNTP